jgi:hypothetical protein
VIIKLKEAAKYLGILLDGCFRWKEQGDEAIKKETAALLAVSHLTRPTYGMLHRYIQQLFTSVVVPKMEYGLAVWYNLIHRQRCMVPQRSAPCNLVFPAFRSHRMVSSLTSASCDVL